MKTTVKNVVLRPCKGIDEYPKLIAIWRSAVRATHDFLDMSDFERIESRLASHYFPAVTIIVAEVAGEPRGFAGVSGNNLEMLFVDDNYRGAGVGSTLLSEAIANFSVTKVDVNEQNKAALDFYLNKGFTQTGRSEVDADGRPYPIIHLHNNRRVTASNQERRF